jgi:hypothetical protein
VSAHRAPDLKNASHFARVKAFCVGSPRLCSAALSGAAVRDSYPGVDIDQANETGVYKCLLRPEDSSTPTVPKRNGLVGFSFDMSLQAQETVHELCTNRTFST